MNEIVGVLLAAFLIAGGVIGGIIGLGYWIEKNSCAALSAAMELESSFGLWQGCMVKVNGHWRPFSQRRSVEIEK